MFRKTCWGKGEMREKQAKKRKTGEDIIFD